MKAKAKSSKITDGKVGKEILPSQLISSGIKGEVPIRKSDYPNPHPKAYCMKAKGNCLAPEIFDGETILVEPIAPRPNEIGVLWRKGKPPVAKYLVEANRDNNGANEPPFLMLAQINPIHYYSAGNIEALHKVVGVVKPEGGLRLLAPFNKVLAKFREHEAQHEENLITIHGLSVI